MLRKLLYLAPLAILGLAACDGGPAALTKAKEGECYTVTGKEPGGAPKWEKTECVNQGSVTAPIEPADADTGTTAPTTTAAASTSAAGACPTVQPVKCPTVTAAAAPERKRSFWRRSAKQTQQATRTRTRTRSTQTQSSDYERVYTPDYPQQDLLGGLIDRNDSYSSHSRGYSDNRDYAYSPPPPPPVNRYERRDYNGGQAQGYRSEEYRSETYRAPAPRPYHPPVAPPPPPPVYNDHAYSGGHTGGYASGYRSEHSTRQTERRSYSSSSSSSHTSGGYGCPGRCPERSVMAPMNGPHFPVDQDGYLTWRGKTR